ncbi:DNA-binding response regulator [Fibrisoma montanum]|uniref:DNA-binding response regulator n=1 Tax=Fibrisoma montanum TaxID=2305895 RepID=A0A418MI67_9BACT|nr:response regulator transcription factor [Fibrisoma montanum]RIV27107.1 DNA-binding response regulator [Fibrisoma montanum]
MPTTVAIADDHLMMAQALSDLIEKIDGYEMLFVAENGRDLINHLKRKQIPDILLLDISMPVMDGFETAQHLREHYPEVKILVLSMSDRDEDIIRMMRYGVCGYLLKGSRPSELRRALEEVRSKGSHYSEFLTERVIRNLHKSGTELVNTITLNDRETKFLQLSCSDLTYVEIADKMCVAPRTVDGYRESLFQKMNVKSRVGMVLEALRHGLVDLKVNTGQL